jgi:hypothetical protein
VGSVSKIEKEKYTLDWGRVPIGGLMDSVIQCIGTLGVVPSMSVFFTTGEYILIRSGGLCDTLTDLCDIILEPEFNYIKKFRKFHRVYQVIPWVK